jgi:hypothetical protein
MSLWPGNTRGSADPNRIPSDSKCARDSERMAKTGAGHVRPRLSLRASDSLILQNPDDDPTVLSLSLCGRVGSHLLAGVHRSGRQHIRNRNVALLFQEFQNVVSALRAEFLVESALPTFDAYPCT